MGFSSTNVNLFLRFLWITINPLFGQFIVSYSNTNLFTQLTTLIEYKLGLIRFVLYIKIYINLITCIISFVAGISV